MSENTKDPSTDEGIAAAFVRKHLELLGPGGARRVLEGLLSEHDPAAELSVPVFARGVAGPLGKLECDLKTKVDEHTDALFRSHCAMAKSDPSSVLRDCVYALVHKRTYSQMVVEKLIHDAKRTDALQALTGLFQGPEFGGARHG